MLIYYDKNALNYREYCVKYSIKNIGAKNGSLCFR